MLVKEGSRRLYKLTSKQVTCYEGKLVLMLLCLSLQATCSLVHSLTCPLINLPCYPVFHLPCLQATCSLVHLPCYPVFYFPCLQATGLLVYSLTCLLFNKKTNLPCIFNKFCYICKLFNTYVSHVC